jgi:hypothetical protein
MEQAYLHETGVDVAVIHKFDYSVPPLHAEVYKKCTNNSPTAAVLVFYCSGFCIVWFCTMM